MSSDDEVDDDRPVESFGQRAKRSRMADPVRRSGEPTKSVAPDRRDADDDDEWIGWPPHTAQHQDGLWRALRRLLLTRSPTPMLSNEPTTPTAGPDTAGWIYRLTDSLRIEVHRPEDEDGEWIDAVTSGLSPRDETHAFEIRAIISQLFQDKALWVHDLDAADRHYGLVMGWRAESSWTGWWSGMVLRKDIANRRTLVGNILPGELGHTFHDLARHAP